MDYKIEGEPDAVAFHPLGDAQLLGVRARAGKFAGGFFLRALKTQLKMVETRGHELFEALFVEGQTRGDHAGVQAGGARGADYFGQVGTGQRLATGEVSLQHAEFGGFAQDARP